eukprot:scaffold92531_cov30-Phaeocystis_antarctica.AAC.1
MPPPSGRSKKIGCDHIGCSRRASSRQTPPCLPEKSRVGSRMACPCAVATCCPPSSLICGWPPGEG